MLFKQKDRSYCFTQCVRYIINQFVLNLNIYGMYPLGLIYVSRPTSLLYFFGLDKGLVSKSPKKQQTTVLFFIFTKLQNRSAIKDDLTIEYLVQDCGNHHTERYRWRNCRNVAIAVYEHMITSNIRPLSWGNTGSGICFGETTLDETPSHCNPNL